MKNKKILLIGGCGFIGHNLAIYLKKQGHDVHLVDSFGVNNLITLIDNKDNVPHPDLSKKVLDERLELVKNSNCNLIVQDARDYHALSKTIEQIEPEIVIHLAAVSHADRSNKTPYNTFDHSLRTLENVLDAIKFSKTVEQLIFMSSSMVYGNFDGKEVEEDMNCSPIGIYGALKYAAEKIIIAYNQVFGLNYTIIRPSALYGERCISRRVGQIFIENALFRKKISINGSGKEKLDFTYIQDLIQGISKSISNQKAYNEIFNITYGNGREILELIEIIKDNFGSTEIEFKDKNKLTPERGTLSNAKSKELLKYESKWSIEEGYQKYIDWYKDFFNKKINVQK
tara:strand:+ start:250 stop:1275 length:1026 start_codon:yes stop_codon:yes gene_type:complete